MNGKKLLLLVGCIGICLAAGAVGSLFTFDAIPTWYAGLNKPFFNPPNWLFGPVWSTLYLLMGISLYLVTQIKNSPAKTAGQRYFFIQLVLNTLWSIIFFGWKLPSWAFAEIVILWIMIFLTIKYFLKLNKIAGYLLIPYLAWVSFASILNLAVAILNR